MNKWIGRLAAVLGLCLILAACCAALAEEAAQAEDITSKCSFRVSEGNKDKLRDGSVRTVWSYDNPDAFVGIKLPDGVQAGWLRVEWLFNPTSYELTEFDVNMSQLRQRDQTATFPNIYSMYELLPETVYIKLTLTAMDQSISCIHVYSSGELPREVQVWEAPVEKADLMVVSTHQDDELIFLGGTIPYYATALKKPTIVVYMTNCSRYRRNEALNALWKMGVRNYPEFINLTDKRVNSINEGIELWGGKDNILSLLVERIRRFKPEVIVTQDLDGEYGHNQHKITARAMMYAIEAAADETQYPDSLEKYGAWQVKKLYHHLYKENQITMDWKTPLDGLNGYTPLKVAQIGMQEHASQTRYYSVKDGGKYDNAKFGLYFTMVGEDVAKNDFLENIDPDVSANWSPTPAPEVEAAALSSGEAEAEQIGEASDGAEPETEQTVLPDAQAEPAGEVLDETVESGTDAPTAPEAGLIEETGTTTEAEPETLEEAPVGTVVGPVEEVGAPVVAEPAMPEETPVEAEPQAVSERSDGGSRGFAILMGVGALVALGLGAWFIWRTSGRGRRTKRRRRR